MEYLELDRKIEEFDNLVNPGAFMEIGMAFATALTPGAESYWTSVWRLGKEIRVGFKETRYPTKEDRQDAWSKFNKIFDDAVKKSNEEKESRRTKSEELRDEIMEEIESSRFDRWYQKTPEDARQMKEYSFRLRDAGRKFKENKSIMLNEHKSECFTFLREIQEEHNKWWNEYKEERRDYELEKLRNNLEKNYERKSKQEEYLEKQKTLREDLQEKYNSAWNDSYRDKVEGWLNECIEKIEEVEGYLEKLDEWIKNDEDRLDELQ